MDISGSNPNSLNVYSDASYNRNIIAQNVTNRILSVYVDDSIGQLRFPGANITEQDGTIYLNKFDASYGKIEDLSANNATINSLSIGTLTSLSDVSINILPNVDNIYFGTDASYIELGNENTVINIQGTQKVKVLESDSINNNGDISTNSLTANTVTATSGVFTTIQVTDNFDISMNITYSSITIEDGNVSGSLTIDANATFNAIGDVCMNNVYISGPLTSTGEAHFTSIDVSNLDVTNLNVTNDTSLNNLTTSGTVNINNGASITGGATVVGDLDCQQSTIVQW